MCVREKGRRRGRVGLVSRFQVLEACIQHLFLDIDRPLPVGTAQFILTFGIRPNEQKLSESQLDDFFAKQTAQLSGLRGYSRTSTFDLRYARTNAESRKLKGLPPSDEPSPEPSTWLAMHEFDERPSGGVVEKVRKSVRELEGDVVEDIHVWELQKTHGTGRFFE